jgi:hypothetical protein
VIENGEFEDEDEKICAGHENSNGFVHSAHRARSADIAWRRNHRRHAVIGIGARGHIRRRRLALLDNDRVSRTVEAHLKNLDPVMELALIEAAAPTRLVFDPEKSRLILDPLLGLEVPGE